MPHHHHRLLWKPANSEDETRVTRPQGMKIYFPFVRPLGDACQLQIGIQFTRSVRRADAETQYAAFLNAWANADEGVPQVEDAKRRLAALRQAIP